MMNYTTNHTTIIIESWLIPIDIFRIVCSALALLLAFIFLCIVIFKQSDRTVTMMLASNSCLTELIFSCTTLGMAVFTLYNDVYQLEYEDPLCVFRGYMGYVSTGLQNYSYALQAIYRYIIVVYPSHRAWISRKIQVGCIIVTWIFSFTCDLPLYFTGKIIYDKDNQICQQPLGLSIGNIYNYLCVHGIPISIITFIYIKLIYHVHRLNSNSTSVNMKVRAKRELKFVRRIFILVCIVLILGLPYVIFFYISIFTKPTKYYFRIAYIFVDISLFLIMLVSFKFTEPVYGIVQQLFCKPIENQE